MNHLSQGRVELGCADIRAMEHYCYTSKWVRGCKCCVYSLSQQECERLVKRCCLFKPTKIKFLNNKEALFYYLKFIVNCIKQCV